MLINTPFAAFHLASLRVPEYTGAASAVYALYFVPLAVLAVSLARWRPLAAPAAEETGAGEGPRTNTGVAVGKRPRRVMPARVAGFAMAAMAALAALIIFHPLSAPRPDGRLRVDFLDVGQGDAALVTMPDGTTLLIDGGGRPRFRGAHNGEGAREESGGFEPDAREIGDRVVSEFLWHRGLDRVNFVVATHADADHIRGLKDVLANFRVDFALVARAPAADAEYARFAAAAERAGVPVYLIARGDALRFGSASVEVLWPPPAAPNSPSDNDDSVVIRFRLGRRTILLTGDIEARAEAALAATDSAALACDVLKVAHHGSRTSSTEKFLAATRPALAVIPAPLDSPHGHPHAEVLARLHTAGAQVLTTGESGTVTISTDGEDLRVETFVHGR